MECWRATTVPLRSLCCGPAFVPLSCSCNCGHQTPDVSSTPSPRPARPGPTTLGTVFAYGQTSSGKTFTMGSATDIGVMHYGVRRIFDTVTKDPDNWKVRDPNPTSPAPFPGRLRLEAAGAKALAHCCLPQVQGSYFEIYLKEVCALTLVPSCGPTGARPAALE